MRVLKNRIYQQLDWNQTGEQAGFRRSYKTTDHIHTLNQLLEKAKEYKLEVHLVFIDFRKAFDTIKQGKIWEALLKQAVDNKVIRILRKMYNRAKAYVKLENKGAEFRVRNGVKQGDQLSSNIFNSVLEEIFKKLDWSEKGIKVDERYLNNLRFADDIVLISSNSSEIQEMLQDLENESIEGGLEMNLRKQR